HPDRSGARAVARADDGGARGGGEAREGAGASDGPRQDARSRNDLTGHEDAVASQDRDAKTLAAGRLLLPPRRIHPHDEEPQAERDLPQRRHGKDRKDRAREGWREEHREAVDQIAHALDPEQHADRPREESRADDQVPEREAEEAEEHE